VQKARLMDALSPDLEALALAGIRARHPGAPPEEERMRLAALKLGRKLVIEVYGWDPDEKGW
jgi:hypothetical protein